jgi:hypothetical protein
MSERRTDRRRADKRAFRPTVDGQLEDRKLMAVETFIFPPLHIQTAHNGSAVDITTPQGQSFLVSVTNKFATGVVEAGTVKAFYMGGGKFGLVVSGTSLQSDLTINPIIDHRFKGTAHVFNAKQSNYTNMLNIGSLKVVNGTIGDIEGYKTAILSGPLIAAGPTAIDRIALDAIVPGGSILTGGDVDTLDIFDSVSLSGAGTGIVIGRDLNYFNAFGNVSIANGAIINVGRDIGLTEQQPKGTGPGPGQGMVVQGALTIGPGSSLIVNRFLDFSFTNLFGSTITVNGPIVGFSRIIVGFSTPIPGTINAPGIVVP